MLPDPAGEDISDNILTWITVMEKKSPVPPEELYCSLLRMYAHGVKTAMQQVYAWMWINGSITE